MSDLLFFPIMSRNSKAQARIKNMLLAWYKQEVKDDKLREKMTPIYDVGCKRLLPTSTYLQAIQLPHVELVTSKIDHIEKDGIVTQEPK